MSNSYFDILASLISKLEQFLDSLSLVITLSTSQKCIAPLLSEKPLLSRQLPRLLIILKRFVIYAER